MAYKIAFLFILLFVGADAHGQTNFQKSNASVVPRPRRVASGVSSVLLGDVDGSGTLTTNDVTELQKLIYTPGYAVAHSELADMNLDGKLNIVDVSLLVEVLLHPNRGYSNGYEYVDLGLSVKWATCNIGADDPQQYGAYFAWGETTEKDTYLWDYYKYITTGYHNWEGCSKYQIADNQKAGVWYDGNTFVGDSKTTLDSSDDATTTLWGTAWRMPTKDEMKELTKKCKWLWISDNYRKGYLVARNGWSIFIPAAGCCHSVSYYGTGSYGYYWTRNLTASYTQYAYSLYINRNEKTTGMDDRSYGLTIRPIHP